VDPEQAGVISHAIDHLFENGGIQTHTETEAQYRASTGVLGGNLVFLLDGIGLAVIFTLLLVTANTMSMAVRGASQGNRSIKDAGLLKPTGFGIDLDRRSLAWAMRSDKRTASRAVPH
jgi:hypothetical protein